MKKVIEVFALLNGILLVLSGLGMIITGIGGKGDSVISYGALNAFLGGCIFSIVNLLICLALNSLSNQDQVR